MPAAVTHDDLSIRKAHERRVARSGSQVAVSLVALSVICGLVAFILCLAAEGSRSEASLRRHAPPATDQPVCCCGSVHVSYYVMTAGGNQNQMDVCFYNSSGRAPLAYSIGAFLLLAVAMFAEHGYMLVAVASPESASAGLAVAQDHPRVPATVSSLTWQTCCLFFLTCSAPLSRAFGDGITIARGGEMLMPALRDRRICFGLAEVLLMIGIGVESGHVSDWRRPRPVCHRVRPGMFAAAGILGLITVVVGFVVYVTAVQARKLQQGHYPGGGHYVGHGAPYPGVPPYQHMQPPMAHPHPVPHAVPSAPGAPEIRPAACQVEPSRASLITKEITDV
ncbi:hypothetical protein EJB05_32114, partial [Eragrostis curvula]